MKAENASAVAGSGLAILVLCLVVSPGNIAGATAQIGACLRHWHYVYDLVNCS